MIKCRLHDVIEVDQHEGCWVCNLEDRLKKEAKAKSTAVPLEQSAIGQDDSALWGNLRKWISEEFDVMETTIVTFVPKKKKV